MIHQLPFVSHLFLTVTMIPMRTLIKHVLYIPCVWILLINYSHNKKSEYCLTNNNNSPSHSLLSHSYTTTTTTPTTSHHRHSQKTRRRRKHRDIIPAFSTSRFLVSDLSCDNLRNSNIQKKINQSPQESVPISKRIPFHPSHIHFKPQID